MFSGLIVFDKQASCVQSAEHMDAANVVIDAINHLKGLGRTHREIAQVLNVSIGTISYYLNGMPTKSGGIETPKPSAELLITSIKALGGDIRRALPVGHPEAYEEDPEGQEELLVVGRVAAGVVSYGAEERRTIRGAHSAFRPNKYWPHTRPVERDTPVVYVEVVGDSMSPAFEDGCLLACRPPRDQHSIPDLAPCIFRDGEMCTVKLFQRGPDGWIVAIPVNRSYQVQHFRPHDGFEIQYVVVGKIDPWKSGVNFGPPPAMFMNASVEPPVPPSPARVRVSRRASTPKKKDEE